eukprot:4809116-Amphidinium_carterae.1
MFPRVRICKKTALSTWQRQLADGVSHAQRSELARRGLRTHLDFVHGSCKARSCNSHVPDAVVALRQEQQQELCALAVRPDVCLKTSLRITVVSPDVKKKKVSKEHFPRAASER